VKHLEAAGIRTLFNDALAKAAARGAELGRLIDQGS
jgi:hypothetical protein